MTREPVKWVPVLAEPTQCKVVARRSNSLYTWFATQRRALFAGKGELVAVGIFEDAGGAPFLGLGLDGKLHAFGLQDFGGGEEIVAPKGDGLKLADAVLVALGGIERETGLSAGNHQLDPPLFIGEGLIGDDFEAERFRVEL